MDTIEEYEEIIEQKPSIVEVSLIDPDINQIEVFFGACHCSAAGNCSPCHKKL